jgi:hypothetical protein
MLRQVEQWAARQRTTWERRLDRLGGCLSEDHPGETSDE